MATKAAITKVLSCALIFVILMSVMPVSVFAVNDSNNSTGNASNRSNELVNTFIVNNSAEVMIPLFNNNITDNYRAWSEEDNRSGDCAPVPDADLPVIYLNDTQEGVLSSDSGNDTNIIILTDVSDGTRETVSALGCEVYVKIDDPCCVGYCVYVDGVYQFTEGQDGTPDGYCAFYVSAGTHTIKINKNGRSASKTNYFQCGNTYRWVSMPHCWCENGDHGDEVKFRGIVTDKAPEGMTGGYWWDVKVDEWISGSMPCKIIRVRFLVIPDVPIGSYDLSIRIGDYVEAYGSVYPNECSVGLNGESYYIKKISSELLSINVWTDKSEYKIGETVTIYYKTNKKCTAKLTITKPDGGDVVYGPNEIPASTRSKSATAGYPTGKRTVVFEAWAGDEYKKATCYFDVVDEEEWEVKFQGTVNSTYPEETYFSCEVRVDRIISDPDDCIEEGWIVDIVLGDSPCGSYEEVKKGDKIEVFGKRLLVYSFPPQISLCGKSSYYLKKIDSKTLSISVWTDKSEYKIGETVTIYYKTNKKCTAKLTITKPDGGDVVYGPNEIPASTRSKSATAGYPTGKRTVVFEAWAGAEYKKATCYFDVVDEEECEVKFRGIVMDIRGTTPWVQVDKVISGSEYISVGDYTDIACYTTAGETGPCGHCDIVKKGDRVEVYGKRLPIYQIPMVISICGKTSYYMRMIGKPDLVIEDISWSPSNPKQGDKITFTVKIKNQGSENAEGFYVCYYIDGSYYAREYISSLSAGSTTTTSFTWTAECGSHSIKAYADCDGTIDESNEDNNEKSIIISIPLGEKNAKIKGRVTNILYPISFPPVYKIEIQKIQEDPLNKFNVGDEVSVSYPWDTRAQIDSEIKAGDRVEAFGGENHECGYDLYLVESDHYIKRIPVKTIYVDDDFVVDEPANHKWNTIQKGIKDANDGDTILVYPGTYTENVDVTKSLTIKSTSGNPEDTIVQAADLYDTAFEVTADDVEISGFTVKGAGAGISLNRANYCNIFNNIASNNDCYGIFLEYSDNNNITNNNANSNKGEGGITLHFSNENTLMNNDILNNAYGIELYHSNSNVLTNNIVKSNNEAGHFIGCIFLVHSSNNVFTNNNVLNNNGGINLDSSSNYNSIYHNDFRDNGKSASDRSGTNSWDKGYPSGGNYWSDYKEKYPNAKEIDDTGIWNTPYEIPGDVGAKDNYPLVEPYLAPSKYLELVKYYAPVIYQDIDDSDPDADYITNFNYDNNWRGNDNWDNQDDGNYSLRPYVYYSIVETETNWFICYAIYHPRDLADFKHGDFFEHENDMEGILEVIEKDGTEYGKFLCMVTVAHVGFFSFIKSNSGVTEGEEDIDGDEYVSFESSDPEGHYHGEHPRIYIQSRGHGIFGSTGRYLGVISIDNWEDGFPGGDGIIYYLGETARVPNSNDKWVHYELISINKLWEKRYNFSEGEPFANYGTFDGDCSDECGSGTFKGCKGAANAPWGYDAIDDGEVYAPDFFMDPAYLADFYFNGLYDEGQKESFHTYISRSYPVIVESFHPVKSGMAQLYYDRTWSWKVEGAKEISLHFKKIELSLEKHNIPDHIEVWGKNVRKRQIIYGAADLDQGWTQPVDGDTIHLRLLANTDTKTGESDSWGFCADRCEPVMPPICVKGGCEDYQPLEVFSSGSQIDVKLQHPNYIEYTFNCERWKDVNENLFVDEDDTWFLEIYHLITTSETAFQVSVPEHVPIGLYRLKIEGTDYVSNGFWVIFDPNTSSVSEEYWKDELTGDRVGLLRKEVGTSHHKRELMLCMASASANGPIDEESAVASFQRWVFQHTHYEKDMPKVEPPPDIMDYVWQIKSGEMPDADCDCRSPFLVALARAAGIPAREIHGVGLEFGLENLIPRWAHAWVEASYSGAWQVWDPTWYENMGTDYTAFIDWHKDNSGLWKLLTVNDELGVDRGSDYKGAKPEIALAAYLSSSANLHAYDSQGNHVGVNTIGGIDLQIPNSYYTGPDSKLEEIIIFGQSENIKFKVEALEEGKFNLTITQSTEAGTKKIIYNDVPIAETTEATVEVSEANPTYIMEIDDDCDGTTDRKREPESIDVIGHDSYPTQLHTGWNLISLPLTPEDTNVLNVLNSVEGNWNSVWSYEGGKWKRYDLTGPNFLNTLTFMEPGKGYWLHMKSEDTLSISGSEPTVKSIPLTAGWNLVGYNSLNSMPTTEAMSSVAGNWNSVWSYEAGRWKRYDMTGPDFLNSLTFMEPGKGYWLNMKSSDTWTLGA